MKSIIKCDFVSKPLQWFHMMIAFRNVTAIGGINRLRNATISIKLQSKSDCVSRLLLYPFPINARAILFYGQSFVRLIPFEWHLRFNDIKLFEYNGNDVHFVQLMQMNSNRFFTIISITMLSSEAQSMLLCHWPKPLCSH